MVEPLGATCCDRHGAVAKAVPPTELTVKVPEARWIQEDPVVVGENPWVFSCFFLRKTMTFGSKTMVFPHQRTF